MTNLIDIKKTDIEIETIKYPIIFLFTLISYKNDFSDMNLSIILRLFIKHHMETCLTINLKELFMNELQNYKLSYHVINEFYKIIGRRLKLIFTLKKWNIIYKNRTFWKLTIGDQHKYLLNMKDQFLSIFDCSKGGLPYHYKISSLLKSSNNYEITENISQRLKMTLKIFGIKLFTYLEIPIITYDEFYTLTKDDLIKYLFIIYEKIIKFLNQTIEIYELFNISYLELDNLFKPYIINIESYIIDSETEIEDIKLICK